MANLNHHFQKAVNYCKKQINENPYLAKAILIHVGIIVFLYMLSVISNLRFDSNVTLEAQINKSKKMQVIEATSISSQDLSNQITAYENNREEKRHAREEVKQAREDLKKARAKAVVRARVREKAKAEAESKRLQGQGIADQRREIARGLEESVEVLNKVGINSQEASALIVVTQHYATLQSIGQQTNSNLILLPNSPQAGSQMLNDMVASFTASNQIGEAMKNAKTNKKNDK
jgi:regulator of protease activity HflC (stomatin/prohibitin superfamily)